MEDKIMKEDNEDVGGLADFNVLTEGCLSSIISLTSPRDACACCLISSTFRSAAESDSVWEKFLLSDYPEILATSSSSWSEGNFTSKKQLYLQNPILIHGGLKSFSLDKNSGKKCYMIGARGLSVTWGSRPQLWKWNQFRSRFGVEAKLRDVCWLDIRGKMETRLLSPKTSYVVYFVFKFKEGTYGFDNLVATVAVEIIREGGNSECRMEKDVSMDPNGLLRSRTQSGSISMWERHFPHKRGDGWFEIDMGYFFNEGEEEDRVEVQMSLREIGSQWKSGLIVEGIEFRPKGNI